MNKNNPRCVVHMYPKKPNAFFFVFVIIFLGCVLCLFQIYNKISQQVLYVVLDQFAKRNEIFFLKHMWDDDVIFYNFKIHKRKSSSNFFCLSLKKVLYYVHFVTFFTNDFVQMGKKKS